MTFADRITNGMATFRFLFVYLAFNLAWCTLGALGVWVWKFDPYPFVFLNFVIGLFGNITSIIIMISQSAQARRDEKRMRKLENLEEGQAQQLRYLPAIAAGLVDFRDNMSNHLTDMQNSINELRQQQKAKGKK